MIVKDTEKFLTCRAEIIIIGNFMIMKLLRILYY